MTISSEKMQNICKRLLHTTLPPLSLSSTKGEKLFLPSLHQAVLFCVPRPSSPLENTPENWDILPGAKGCTVQAESYRDSFETFCQYDYEVYGISAQSSVYQQEIKKRLKLPFDFLSDRDFLLTNALYLPTMKVEHLHLIKRMTLILCEGKIVKIFFPITNPAKNCMDVLAWLRKNTRS